MGTQKNPACRILRLAAKQQSSALPQCDPRGAFWGLYDVLFYETKNSRHVSMTTAFCFTCSGISPVHHLFLLISYLNMNLTKLLFGHFIRCAAHQILSRSAHGECDDLADVLLVAQQHDHTVYAGCHACMRRSTELECIIQRSELAL